MTTQQPFPKLTQVQALHASLSSSLYGTPRPLIVIVTTPAAHHRHAKTVAHMLAARLESETPSNECWCVELEVLGDHRATVSLELMNADPREVDAGMALLHAVVESST